MTGRESPRGTAHVQAFYEQHPYPPPADDIDAYRKSWTDERRLVDALLFWPRERYRDDRSVLIAGCGTRQAAHYAIRWPRAAVTGIDVSEASVASTLELKRRHRLENLEVRLLPIERAAELETVFDHVVCTGVLHHLPDPAAGLRALRAALGLRGALHLMVYAPYGRAGVYLLQDYCRRLGVTPAEDEIRDLTATLKALPPDHPLVPLLRNSPDFASPAGLADALLHPIDRAYSVPQLFDLLEQAELAFGRWYRQAPYVPWCGAPGLTPHAPRLQRLPATESYAALELFRGTMVRHSLSAYHAADAPRPVDFAGDEWLHYRPLRLPEAVTVRERLPAGAAAVLINRNHTFTDLYLPIDESEERLLGAIDGRKTIAQLSGSHDRAAARAFFEKLWRWDQIAVDASEVA
jgi:SAM-dependent methyltransferase